MKRVAFLTLGCKVNAYETEAMEKLFIEAGYEITEFSAESGSPADIYVVNTCTVTNMADRKSRQMLHRARKQNPQALVVAAGCYVQAPQSKLSEEEGVDLLIGNSQKQEIVKLVEEYLAGKGQKTPGELSSSYDTLSIDTVTEKTRANIKIQDGCNQFCSYCIIPYVRGRIRSRRPEEVLAEVERLARQGYREIVLTGIHLSSYGMDWDKTNHLLSLLTELSQIEGIERIRLGSLEPRIMTEEFTEALGALPKLCPHFHLSLQSGCDKTLQRMNRHYTTKEYKNACRQLHQVYQNPALTTDVIVGFPGETEEEFVETKAFVEEIGFSKIHIFPYSKRSGTKAERMEGQIAEAIKKERAARLAVVEARLEERYRQRFVGQEEQVLFEEAVRWQDKDWQIGHTTRYVKVAVPTVKSLEGQICLVKDLALTERDFLQGEVVFPAGK